MSAPTELEKLIDTYCEAVTRADASLLASCFHTDSFAAPAVVSQLTSFAGMHDIECRQMRFRLVGRDDEFCYARSLQRTIAAANDPSFRNNVTDSLYVLAEQDGRPRIWSSQVLTIGFE